MDDIIFDDTPAAVETAAPAESEAPVVDAQEPAVEQQEADQQQEAEREFVRKKKSDSERIPVPFTHLTLPTNREGETHVVAG